MCDSRVIDCNVKVQYVYFLNLLLKKKCRQVLISLKYRFKFPGIKNHKTYTV